MLRLLWLLRAVHDRIIGALAAACALFFAVSLLLIVLDIAFRYFRIGSLPWSIEITEYALYAIAFLGAPWVLREHAHVRMDAIVRILPPLWASLVTAVTLVIGLGASLALVIFGIDASWSAWSDNMVTRKILDYPEWIVLLPIPVAGFLLAVEFVVQLAGGRGPERDETAMTGL